VFELKTEGAWDGAGSRRNCLVTTLYETIRHIPEGTVGRSYDRGSPTPYCLPSQIFMLEHINYSSNTVLKVFLGVSEISLGAHTVISSPKEVLYTQRSER
jgi:hypothetical protein